MSGNHNINPRLFVTGKTITMCARSALFDITMAAPALELAWMEQQGLQWMQDVSPHDNYGRISTRIYKTNPMQLSYQLPTNVYRFTKLGLRFGNRQFSLTVDPSLAMPQSVEFSCDPDFFENGDPELNDSNNADGSGFNSGNYPFSYAPFRSSLPYNLNYYRVQDGMVVFNQPPEQGILFMEWLGSPANYPDTIVHAGYVQPLKNYLLWRYYLQKTSGAADMNKNEFSKYLRLAAMYEQAYYETMSEANRTVKCPSMDDIMDVMNRR